MAVGLCNQLFYILSLKKGISMGLKSRVNALIFLFVKRSGLRERQISVALLKCFLRPRLKLKKSLHVNSKRGMSLFQYRRTNFLGVNKIFANSELK